MVCCKRGVEGGCRVLERSVTVARNDALNNCASKIYEIESKCGRASGDFRLERVFYAVVVVLLIVIVKVKLQSSAHYIIRDEL